MLFLLLQRTEDGSGPHERGLLPGVLRSEGGPLFACVVTPAPTARPDFQTPAHDALCQAASARESVRPGNYDPGPLTSERQTGRMMLPRTRPSPGWRVRQVAAGANPAGLIVSCVTGDFDGTTDLMFGAIR